MAGTSGTQPVHVILKGGTHFVEDTIQIGSGDSHLTIRNANGEHAVVSGGINLTTAWTPSTACKGCYEAKLAGQIKEIKGLRRGGVREIRARYVTTRVL